MLRYKTASGNLAFNRRFIVRFEENLKRHKTASGNLAFHDLFLYSDMKAQKGYKPASGNLGFSSNQHKRWNRQIVTKPQAVIWPSTPVARTRLTERA